VTEDEELMTALHDEHASVLHAFVSRYTDDLQRVQDVVQETLLRAWRGRNRIDPQARARHQVRIIEHCRQRRRGMRNPHPTDALLCERSGLRQALSSLLREAFVCHDPRTTATSLVDPG